MEGDETSIKDYIDLLLRHKYLVISILIVFLIGGSFLYSLERPYYAADASVLLDSEKLSTSFDVGNVQRPEVVMSSIKSYSMITSVIRDLELDDSHISPGIVFRTKDLIYSYLFDNYESPEFSLTDYYYMYASNVQTRQNRGGIIEISVSTHDPLISKEFANSLANRIIENNRESKRNKIQITLNQVEIQLNSIRDALNTRLSHYQDLMLTQGYIRVINTEDRVDLNRQIINSLERELEHLRTQEATLYFRNDTYNRKESEVRSELNDRIKFIEKRIDELRLQTSTLQKDLYSMDRSEFYEANEINFFIKQDESVYSRLILEKQKLLLAQMSETSDIIFLSQAWVPVTSDKLKGLKFMFLSLLAGLIVSFGIIFIIKNFFDTRFTSVDSVENILKEPVIGTIPMILPKYQYSLLHGGKIPVEVEEAYQTLRTNIHFAKKGNHIKTIMICSSDYNEGKTSNAANLARILADSGEKILLIDLNFREPGLQELFLLENDHGFTSIKEKTMKEITFRITDNLDIITSGKLPVHPQNLLESKEFEQFILKVSKKYDQIIMDTTPVLITSETKILSVKVDAAIYVVDLLRSSKKNALDGLKILKEANCNLIGVVLNEKKVRHVYEETD